MALSASTAPKRFAATSTDQVQFLIRQVADQQIHGVIAFDGRLDITRLQHAIRLTLDAEPVLGCRWVLGGRRCAWQLREDLDEIATPLVCDGTALDEMWRFVATPVDPARDPQLQVQVFRGLSDTLCLKFDHVATDAGGAKQYLYFLAETYRQLAGNRVYRLSASPVANRSPFQVLRRHSPLALLRAFRRRTDMPLPNWGFPVAGGSPERALAFRRIPAETMLAVRRYGKQRGATLNDILVTAFYHAMFSLVTPAAGTPLHVQVPVDLRRYLPDNQRSIANLSGMLYTDVAYQPGQVFEDTLRQVHCSMEYAKGNQPGIASGIFFELTQLIGFARLRSSMSQMLGRGQETGRSAPLVTNLGILDEERLSFGDLAIADAFMVGPVLYPPGFALAFSTFRDALTLTAGYSGGREQGELVERCLGVIEHFLTGQHR